ncbi:MAG TPA: sigma 54-interacting transcriptional regulator [Thermoanaerobaculia bacterium]|nr:sigma 54-interacting transcriptional regulator [Thermoanaerobaculia bacterium]
MTLARESKVSAKHASSIREDVVGLSVAKTANQLAGGTEELLLAADPAMLQRRSLARRVAPTDAPVLILGESGVGKEVLARFIHAESARAARPFVKINCAALPPDLLESELFGYELGAFTGAHQRKVGRLELADGGTLLLDEIGEMSPNLQAKLLHVLEDRAFARVGGTEAIRVDARIIATTNKALEEPVRSGEFRKDLYFRLKVVGIDLPPLRARPADIPLLSERFLRLYRDGQGSATSSIPDRLLEGLQRYSWPGNVRELKHVIQRYTIFPDVDMVLSELTADERAHAPGDRFERDAVEMSVDSERDSAGDFVPSRNGRIPLKSIAIKAAEDAEKRVILQVLAQTRWNRRRAAARLDICYKTLLNKINQWQLERDH